MSQRDLYLAELIFNLTRFVQDEPSPTQVQSINELPKNCYVSQDITGDYCARTAIAGEKDVLCSFAAAYSKFEIEQFDSLVEEILADFLNLHNGLFTVSLSDDGSAECSLLAPSICDAIILNAQTYQFSIQFTFGIVHFLLSETD